MDQQINELNQSTDLVNAPYTFFLISFNKSIPL